MSPPYESSISAHDNQERIRRISKEYTSKPQPTSTPATTTPSPQRYYTNRKPSNSQSSTTSSTYLQPTISSTSTSSRPEVPRLSGNFNAPTHVEIERSKETKRSRDGMKGIDKYGKMDAVQTELRLFGRAVKSAFSF